jgi:hypothetical protein
MISAIVVGVLMLPPLARADEPVFHCPASQAAPTAGAEPWPLLGELSPVNRWSCLDGEVIGVLSGYNGGVNDLGWGHATINTIAPPSHGPISYFLFTTGGDSPRVPYWAPPSPSVEALDLSVPDGNGHPYVERSSQLTPATARARKLTKDVHLARIRINGGNGGGGELHVIIDAVEVLDGTKNFPLDVSRAMHEVLEPLGSTTTREGKHWRDLLRTTVADAVKHDPSPLAGATPREVTYGGHRATWLADRRVLQIVFYARMERELTVEQRNKDPQAGTMTCHAPPGADCAPQRVPSTFRTTRRYAAEYGMIIEVTQDGKRTLDERPVRVKAPATRAQALGEP